MKNKPKTKSKKLLCPKACVLNQLDDDRHSDTIVLETQKAIASTLKMLTNNGLKPNTVRHKVTGNIGYKLHSTYFLS